MCVLLCSYFYLQFRVLPFLSFFLFFNPHCGFDLHFPDDQQYWASFHISVGHLHIFFGKRSIHFFCPYFNWVVWFLDIELYEPFMLSCLDPFLLLSFANIFFHSVSCPFCFVGGFLCCGKLLSRSHWFIFIYFPFHCAWSPLLSTGFLGLQWARGTLCWSGFLAVQCGLQAHKLQQGLVGPRVWAQQLCVVVA